MLCSTATTTARRAVLALAFTRAVGCCIRTAAHINRIVYTTEVPSLERERGEADGASAVDARGVAACTNRADAAPSNASLHVCSLPAFCVLFRSKVEAVAAATVLKPGRAGAAARARRAARAVGLERGLWPWVVRVLAAADLLIKGAPVACAAIVACTGPGHILIRSSFAASARLLPRAIIVGASRAVDSLGRTDLTPRPDRAAHTLLLARHDIERVVHCRPRGALAWRSGSLFTVRSTSAVGAVGAAA